MTSATPSRKQTTMPSAQARRGWMSILVVLVAIGIATVSALVLISTPSATAETPAERCARETAAYNSAWAQSWAASNGKPASQAPPPPVPYTCVDPGPPTSSTTPPPSVTAPTIPTDTATPDTGGPNMGAHAPTDIPEGGQTPIVPIPGDGERSARSGQIPGSPPAGRDSPDRGDPAALGRVPVATPTERAGPEARPGPPVSPWLPGDRSAEPVLRMSPTFMAQWKQLKRESWTIDWESGGGAQTIRNGREKVIQIDGSRGTKQTSQWLAHEMGHAIYQPEPIDRSSYQACLDSWLIGEGQATFNNIVIQREIIAAGGMDIGISGPPAGAANAIYDRYLSDVASMKNNGTWTAEAEQAAKRRAWIGLGRQYGQLKTPTTGPTYADYYGAEC